MALLDFITSKKPEDVERRLRLAQAMSGMSLRPNVGLQQAIAGRLQGIESQRQKAATAQAAEAQRNKTAQWLMAQGRGDLAQGILTGSLTGQQAFDLYKQQPKDERTALQKNIEYLTSQGLTQDEALRAIKTGTTVNVNTGPDLPDPEKGYMWQQTDGAAVQVPVPGGTVQQELEQSVATAQESLKTINEALVHPGLSKAVGPLDALTPTVMPDAKAFEAYHNQIKGKAFLQAFESLKGGGQITEIEGMKAEQAIARLDIAQSEEDYKQALVDLKEVIEAGLARSQGRLQAVPGGSSQQDADPLGIRQ